MRHPRVQTLDQFSVLIKFLLGAFLISITLLGAGCISATSYVDSALPKIDAVKLKPTAVKRPFQLFFEFQTNGSTNFTATKALQPHVVSVLERSNLFSHVVTQGAADRKVFITVNNFPITKDAASKGFRVGLTFGLSGTMVTDGYTMDVVYRRVGEPELKKRYNHALHTTVGNADGPPGVVGMKPGDAILKIMEELILNLLNDLIKAGEI